MNIGVFDSGLGGLTVVQALQKVLKGVNLYYVADTKNAPYGGKSPQEILEYSLQVTAYLIKTYEIEVLVLACNTATSFAIKTLRERYSHLIIIGTEPAIKPATLETKTGYIGVLATPATLEGEKYQELVYRLSKRSSVAFFAQGCEGLVEEIEKGNISTDKSKNMLENWLLPMKDKEVDTIVLGCTHYPLIAGLIYEIMGKDIKLIDSADAIAKHLMLLLLGNKAHKNEGSLMLQIETTGQLDTCLVQRILNEAIIAVKINIK